VDEETGRSDVRVARQAVPGVSPPQGLRGVPVRQAVDRGHPRPGANVIKVFVRDVRIFVIS
jgi:hypothetical protein